MAGNKKLKDVIHYLCHLAPALNMGLVQMMKTVLFAERESLLTRGAFIAAPRFVKAAHGPVPDGWREILAELQADGKIEVKWQEASYEPTECRAIGPFDGEALSLDDEEKRILRKEAEAICSNFSASKISELTHNEFWEMVGMGEEIPFTAYLPATEPPLSGRARAFIGNRLSELGYGQPGAALCA